jgi:hypothetical protein
MAMKTETEQKYYSNLWKIIHGKTNDFTFYRLNAQGSAELDTALLAGYVLANYPTSIRHTVPETIYQIPNTPFSENVSCLIMNNSRKGFSLALKEKDGRHRIMVNAGTGPEQNKKRTLSFTALSLDDTAGLRKNIALQVIKNDIEFVLQKNLRLKSNRPVAAILSSISKNTATPKGTFEKHFKSLIREQGASSSPAATARYLFSAMPYSEKRKLNVSLNAMGIQSNGDMERLLHKWTAEALKAQPKPAVSKARTREPEYGR